MQRPEGEIGNTQTGEGYNADYNVNQDPWGTGICIPILYSLYIM